MGRWMRQLLLTAAAGLFVWPTPAVARGVVPNALPGQKSDDRPAPPRSQKSTFPSPERQSPRRNILPDASTARPGPAEQAVVTPGGTSRPWLAIDPAGFMSDVLDVAFSPDGRQVAAAAEKSVRVWDVTTGELLHTLRGDMHDYTAYGNCYATAYSPDGRELLVGVHDEEAGAIRVYDAKAPTEIKELVGGRGRPVVQFAFSRNGRYLAAVGDNGRIVVWDWPARRQVAEIPPSDAKQPVYDLVAFPTEAPLLLAVDPQGPRLFSIPDGRLVFSPAEGRKAGSSVPDEILAWFDSVFGGKVRYPADGKPRKAALRLEQATWAMAVDGRETGRPAYRIGVWKDGLDPSAVYRGHRWTALSVALSSDGRYAASGDKFGEVHIWEVATGRSLHVCRSLGSPVYEVAFAPSEDAAGDFSLAFGTSSYGVPTWTYNRRGPARKSFDLAQRAIRSWNGPADAGAAPLEVSGRTVTVEQPDPNVSEFVARAGGRETGRYRLRSGAAPSGFFLLSGPRLGIDHPAVWFDNQGVMACWDVDSDRLRRAFIGHSGYITAADESPDGRLLVSASTDRTIRLWRLDGYRPTGVPEFRYQDDIVIDVKPDSEAARADIRVDDRIVSIDGKTFERLSRERVERTYAYSPGQRVPLRVERNGREFEVTVPLVAGDDYEDPLLTLFMTSAGEWILWTPQGYYDASPGADRLIGWHVNRGPGRAASFYPAQQFRKQLYRPDVIDAILRTGDAAEALVEVGQRTGRDEGLDFRSPGTLERYEPPSVRLAEPQEGASVVDDVVQVRAELQAVGKAPLTEARILVNGNPIKTVRLIGAEAEVAEQVPLLPGKNTVAVVGYAGETPSEPRPVRVTRKLAASSSPDAVSSKPAASPPPATGSGRPPVNGPTRNLYLLAVGVTRYENEALNTLRFPAADAKAFAEVVEGQADGRLYGRVESKVMLDADATRAGILEGIDWLTQSAAQDDVAVLFVSAHGLHDESGRGYYLAAHDSDPERLRSTAVPWTDITKALAYDFRGCNRVLFIDTCHSGGVTGPGSGLFNPVQEEAAADVGAIVYASSTFRQKSLELDDHGAFTKGLLTLLKDPQYDLLPRPSGDGLQTVDEVSTNLRDLVPRLTDEMQSPVVSIPTSVRNYQLFEVLNR